METDNHSCHSSGQRDIYGAEYWCVPIDSWQINLSFHFWRESLHRISSSKSMTARSREPVNIHVVYDGQQSKTYL